MRNDRGFTLIELLVVLAILVIVGALILPRVDGLLPGTQLKTSARRLAINVRYLANQSILKAVPFRLYIDTKKNTYWAAAWRNGELVEVTSRLFKRKHLPQGISFIRVEQSAPLTEEKEIPYIIFLPSGEVEETLVVIGSVDRTRKLTLLVSAYGGKTEIRESSGEDDSFR